MEETNNQVTEVPTILTRVDQEKFRRKLAIASRIIAILLICSIFYIGYGQVKYAKEVFSIKEKYGSLGYCYMCGLETFRSCGCNYLSPFQKNQPGFNLENYSLTIAESNTIACPPLINRTLGQSNFKINLSINN